MYNYSYLKGGVLVVLYNTRKLFRILPIFIEERKSSFISPGRGTHVECVAPFTHKDITTEKNSFSLTLDKQRRAITIEEEEEE